MNININIDNKNTLIFINLLCYNYNNNYNNYNNSHNICY